MASFDNDLKEEVKDAPVDPVSLYAFAAPSLGIRSDKDVLDTRTPTEDAIRQKYYLLSALRNYHYIKELHGPLLMDDPDLPPKIMAISNILQTFAKRGYFT